MVTVPRERQLPHISHCCPGIGPQGGGVQKVVNGVQGTHMKEIVAGGRKRRFPLAFAGKELKRRDQLESSSA